MDQESDPSHLIKSVKLQHNCDHRLRTHATALAASRSSDDRALRQESLAPRKKLNPSRSQACDRDIRGPLDNCDAGLCGLGRRDWFIKKKPQRRIARDAHGADFAALRSSAVGSQHCKRLQLRRRSFSLSNGVRSLSCLNMFQLGARPAQLRLRNAGIPAAVEAMRQYWMPIRYPRAR